jgi:hypothetical protein
MFDAAVAYAALERPATIVLKTPRTSACSRFIARAARRPANKRHESTCATSPRLSSFGSGTPLAEVRGIACGDGRRRYSRRLSLAEPI